MGPIQKYFSDILVCYVLTVLSAVSATMQSMSQEQLQSNPFDVKPGAGLQQFSRDWGTFSCTFSYKAQGGTKEAWALTIYRDGSSSEWMCVVERPSGHSYLFFEEFKLQVTGAKLSEVLLEKAPGVQLKDSEYEIAHDSNYVRDKPGKFNSQLTKVQVYALHSGGEL